MATLGDLNGLIDKLASRRLVFVGETHDRYEDHLNQLAIIDGLRLRGKDVAIGMEPFQQPFQGDLDAYIAGTIDEAELLRRTDYFERWRYDYRLYRPILRLARAHGIPVIALNLEREITEAVGDGGLEALDSAQRSRIPVDLDRSDPAYVAGCGPCSMPIPSPATRTRPATMRPGPRPRRRPPRLGSSAS
jgi:hypothetical protein